MTAAVRHPARFSDDILDVIADHVAGARWVLDPFAGTGRIHELRARGIPHTVGVEIEPEWAAMHPDTVLGDALRLGELFPAGSVPAIATSPTYGNRMADHHTARDTSERKTYRHQLGRPLAPTNSGAMQWGDTYRDFHRRVWRSAFDVLEAGGLFVLNVKNHIRKNEVQQVAEWHLAELVALGLTPTRTDLVPTRGLPRGANHDKRVPHELVVSLRKPTRTTERSASA